MTNFFYTAVDQYNDQLLLRGIEYDNINSKRIKAEMPYRPILYKNSDAGQRDALSIFGQSLRKIEFDSINLLSKSRELHGQHNPIIQWINRELINSINYDRALLDVVYIDIETNSENGFPHPDNPIQRVTVRLSGSRRSGY